MIVGLGNDLVDIRRIEKSLERFGARFLARVFTEGEQARAGARAATAQGRAAFYAKRFAAKEAAAKALGTGIGDHAWFTDLEVGSLASGQPVLSFHGRAARTLAALVPAGHRPVIHLTMSDEYPLAQAVVILSAEPRVIG
ncbi:holo-[acyl-carrier-protein] synthase [mine drainage metagenome]|uniref:Holo-[acyl-carrier-protein] synthase n=1 Tax=mine drainage metagenome TaxID=410659 RepID=A0A1J5RME2_9ZZZZ